MLNHVHLVVSAPDVSGFLRDFKRFTSHELQKNIIATEPSVLRLFAREESKDYQFWQPENMPILIESDEMLTQKVDYIHFNPVRKQYVHNPKDWVWSSANPESVITIDPVEA